MASTLSRPCLESHGTLLSVGKTMSGFGRWRVCWKATDRARVRLNDTMRPNLRLGTTFWREFLNETQFRRTSWAASTSRWSPCFRIARPLTRAGTRCSPTPTARPPPTFQRGAASRVLAIRVRFRATHSLSLSRERASIARSLSSCFFHCLLYDICGRPLECF